MSLIITNKPQVLNALYEAVLRKEIQILEVEPEVDPVTGLLAAVVIYEGSAEAFSFTSGWDIVPNTHPDFHPEVN